MVKVPNAVEILPKIWTAWVGRTNVTDDRQTTDGQEIAYTANLNVSSRSLKSFSRRRQHTINIASAVLTVTVLVNMEKSKFRPIKGIDNPRPIAKKLSPLIMSGRPTLVPIWCKSTGASIEMGKCSQNVFTFNLCIYPFISYLFIRLLETRLRVRLPGGCLQVMIVQTMRNHEKVCFLGVA